MLLNGWTNYSLCECLVGYETGLWNIDRVWNVVGKVITEEEYFTITSLVYPEKNKFPYLKY